MTNKSEMPGNDNQNTPTQNQLPNAFLVSKAPLEALVNALEALPMRFLITMGVSEALTEVKKSRPVFYDENAALQPPAPALAPVPEPNGTSKKPLKK